MQSSPRKILVRLAKWLLGILLGLILLLLLVWGLLQTRWGQQKFKEIAVSYLQDKLKTQVRIGSINIKWLSQIEVKDIYLEDRRQKPLLSVKRLFVAYDLANIFRNQLGISRVDLDGTQVALRRQAIDTKFNYDFIAEAFGSPATSPKDTSTKAFALKLGKVSIRQFNFLMEDQAGGQVVEASMGSLLADFKKFDLEHMAFHVKSLRTDSLQFAISITKKSDPAGSSDKDPVEKTSPLSLASDSLLLKGTRFTMDNKPVQFKLQTEAGELGGSTVVFDLAKMHAEIRHLKLIDHTTSLSTVSVPATSKNIDSSKKSASKPFTFSVARVEIDRNNVQFDDNGKPKTASGIDPAHLGLQGLRLLAEKIKYDGLTYEAAIQQLSVAEKSGFRLQSLQVKASYADTGLSLQGLQLNTSQNQISGNAQLSYASLSAISSQPASTKVKLDLQRSRIQLDELLYFAPGLKKNKSFQPLLGKIFYINTRISGQLNKLNIPELLVVQDQTRLLASADVYDLPDTKKIRIDLHLKEFSGNKKDLLGFLPKNTIPDSLLHFIPENFKLTGNYKGSLDNMLADLKLVTSSGEVAVKGTLKNISDPKRLNYDLDLQMQEIRLGELLQDTTLGNITARVKVKGHGTDLKTASANVQASILSAQYLGYNYHDIDLDAHLQDNAIAVNMDSRDPNLALRTKTIYNMDKSHGSLSTATTIDRVDLFKLGFYKDTLTLSGKIDADIPQLDSGKVNGKVVVSAVGMEFANRTYHIDSISLAAMYANDTQAMKFNSPFADATLKGKYVLTSMPGVAKTIFNRYLYTGTDKDTSFAHPMSATLDAFIHIPDSLLGLLPGVKAVSPFTLTARVDTDSSLLGFLTRIKSLQYGDMLFDSITLAALYMPSSDSFKTMKYLAQVEHLTSPSLTLEKSMITGTIHQGIIDGKIELDDANEKPRYIIPYVYTNNLALPKLKIGDSLLINRQEWNVNKNNVIYLDKDSLKGSNLVFSNNAESVSILADSINSNGLPLTLRLKDFRLNNISDAFVSDSSLVQGTANGNLDVLSFSPFNFTSTLTIDSLKLKEINAGKMVINVKEEVPNEMLADISLKGFQNDVELKGKYQAKESEADLQLNMNSFDLQNVAPFVTDYLGKLQGRIKGNITVKGNISSPQIRGNLLTDSVDLEYKDYGTRIRIPAGELLLNDEGLRFSNFEFLDSAGHKGEVTGSLVFKSLTDYQVDAKITTHRYLVIDRKKNADQMIFGPTWADAAITMKGNQELISIDGTVKVIDSSKLTYTNTATAAAGRGEGLIEFFDPMHPEDTLVIKAKKKIASTGPKIAVNTYITVTPTSKVTIILDEYSGDQLVVQGTAGLNFSMSAGGVMTLTGNYEVEKGDYDLSMAQLIKRKFSIVKGSRITWNGDPLKAEMNITALYKVRTTAGELVNDIQNVPGIDKQKLDFEVYLILTKEMLKPDINFRLDMPESDRDAFDSRVYNRIRQVNSIPSDLNKQVMGLLVLNHFISENPFSSLSTTGSSMETTVYNTAGKVLTQELTDLVGSAVKGVDIDFNLDINDDYTESGSVERNTDLKMGVRKSLANNRLQVYVGSTFALEGHNQNASSVSGLAGDITLEYMLTKDGRYRIKGFRINEEDMSFEGTIVKTGVTFVVVLEFNKVKNAFKSKKKKSGDAAQ